VGGHARQMLTLVTRHGDTFEKTGLDAVIFVPLLTGQV
jgi:hypothetical protein